MTWTPQAAHELLQELDRQRRTLIRLRRLIRQEIRLARMGEGYHARRMGAEKARLYAAVRAHSQKLRRFQGLPVQNRRELQEVIQQLRALIAEIVEGETFVRRQVRYETRSKPSENGLMEAKPKDLSKIQERIRQGYYLTKTVIDAVAEKLLKELKN